MRNRTGVVGGLIPFFGLLGCLLAIASVAKAQVEPPNREFLFLEDEDRPPVRSRQAETAPRPRILSGGSQLGNLP
ncbi:MAG: hypothetical protein KDD44_09110, partial [Bdellovibrionales bacterium]|nr:hypothetical protein [Bdellovibrionales bacterium]